MKFGMFSDPVFGGIFTLMVIIMGMFMFLGVSASWLENNCKAYLAEHGYNFVRYHKPGLFGGSEECWGEKDGVNSRVY